MASQVSPFRPLSVGVQRTRTRLQMARRISMTTAGRGREETGECMHAPSRQTNQVCTINLRIRCFSDSDVVNMISIDIVFLQKALRFVHLPWAFPLQLLLSVSFLYSILGMSILQGERRAKKKRDKIQ